MSLKFLKKPAMPKSETRRIGHFLVALVVASAGCAPVETKRAEETEFQVEVTLCDVLDDRSSYLGKTIRMSVDYVADGMTFAFVRDPSCGPRGMGTGNIEGDSGDESYQTFLKEREASCRTSVCVVPATLDATIEFKPDSDGVLSAFIRKVHSAKIGVD